MASNSAAFSAGIGGAVLQERFVGYRPDEQGARRSTFFGSRPRPSTSKARAAQGTSQAARAIAEPPQRFTPARRSFVESPSTASSSRNGAAAKPLPPSIMNGAAMPAASGASSAANQMASFIPPSMQDYSNQPLATATTYRWTDGNYNPTQRLVDTWAFVIRVQAARWWNDQKWTYPLGYSEEAASKRRRELAAWIREVILDLGPTFIKCGQFFSTRADLLPVEYVEELSKLQDRVPAFSFEEVEAIIKKDQGGRGVKELFAEFDRRPIAAASLGQVHRARLHTGEEVVVKVQRPGLKALFDIDIEILRGLAAYFQAHPKYGKGREWLAIYEECRTTLYEEIDYPREGRNADTFRRNFAPVPWVKVPRVYWPLSADNMLVLEYVPGVKITDFEGIDAAGYERERIARRSAEAYLLQIIKYGLFHADPHPGNIAVTMGPAGEEQLVFYDFGMMGEIPQLTRDRILQIFYGIANKDAQQIITALVEVGAIVPQGDMGPIRRAVQYFLDNLNSRPAREQTVAAIGEDLYSISEDQPFRFPAAFTFVLRAFSTLEGICKSLDPAFQFSEVAAPFAQEIVRDAAKGAQASAGAGVSILTSILNLLNGPQGGINTDPQAWSDAAATVRSEGLSLVGTSLTVPGRVEKIEETLGKLERGDLAIRARSVETERLLKQVRQLLMATNLSLLAGAGGIGASFLYNAGNVPAASAAGAAAGAAGLGVAWTLYRAFNDPLSRMQRRAARMDKRGL